MSFDAPRARRSVLAVASLAAVFLPGCTGDDDGVVGSGTTRSGATAAAATRGTSVPAVTVEATDDGTGGGYAFRLPATIAAGPTQFSLRNTGAEPHHAQLFRLAEGSSVEDLAAQLADDDPSALLAAGTLQGGTGVVDPGATSSADAIVELEAGTYVFMCFIEGLRGPHVADGMLQPFTVAAGANGAAVPEPAAEVELVDYSFEIPSELPAGGVVLMTNGSTMEPHEMSVLDPQEGIGVEEVLAFFESEEPPAGPPPVSGVGGLQAILPGASQALELDLEPGRYIVVCLIPSVLDGVPHAAKGMITEVTLG